VSALLAAGCGLLVVGGVGLIALGWRPRSSAPRRPVLRGVRSTLLGRFGSRRVIAFTGWLAAGAVAAAVSGWTLLVALGPALGLAVPYLLGKPTDRQLELLTALDRWVRGLAAILPTGRSISDAVRASVRQAPEPLADPLRLLVQRLDDRWTLQQALYAMADELDSADADAVIAALALAAERGGTGGHATLVALADAIGDRVRALREIETERAKPRIVVRQVTSITLVVLGAAMLFSGGFFEPYRTPAGQVILTALIAAYLGSLLWLRRMAVPRARQRILQRQAP